MVWSRRKSNDLAGIHPPGRHLQPAAGRPQAEPASNMECLYGTDDETPKQALSSNGAVLEPPPGAQGTDCPYPRCPNKPRLTRALVMLRDLAELMAEACPPPPPRKEREPWSNGSAREWHHPRHRLHAGGARPPHGGQGPASPGRTSTLRTVRAVAWPAPMLMSGSPMTPWTILRTTAPIGRRGTRLRPGIAVSGGTPRILTRGGG